MDPEACPPGTARDLNLDRLIETICAQRREQQLQPFFAAPPRDRASVVYRQEVMRDLEDPEVRDRVDRFCQAMGNVLSYQRLARESSYRYHREGWHLDAAMTYVEG